jgi:hypothetical protein
MPLLLPHSYTKSLIVIQLGMWLSLYLEVRGVARMESQLDEKLADLELLVEVSQLLTLTDLDGVLNRVIKLASDALGGTRTSLFLHDDHGIVEAYLYSAWSFR